MEICRQGDMDMDMDMAHGDMDTWRHESKISENSDVLQNKSNGTDNGSPGDFP
jgi:hypothetical protein